MKSKDKFRADIDAWSRQLEEKSSSSKYGTSGDFEKLRTSFYYAVPAIPDSTKSAFYTSFLSHYQEDAKSSLEWLSGIVSVLLCDYDDTVFSDASWAEIRDLVTLDSEDINIDTLTYILNLVLEHVGI